MTTTRISKNLQSYLSRSRWVADAPGSAGALWRRSVDGREQVLAVPRTAVADGPDWEGVIGALARYEGVAETALRHRVSYFGTDVVRFRAVGESVEGGSIPLGAGVHLAETARRTLRACATTARGPRARIRGNFSRDGDRVVDAAILGPSEPGSYVLPVFLVLSEVAAGESEPDPGLLGKELMAVRPEPPERRVTRTLAEAMAAILHHVVEPGCAPTPGIVAPLAASGASRELVSAIAETINLPVVEEFEVSFDWAASHSAPGRVPTSACVPATAAARLTQAAQILGAEPRKMAETVTGPIVEIRHVPGESFGEIAVQTIRRGRAAEVRARIRAGEITASHEWMEASRTVLVEGTICREPGRPLRIIEPRRVQPLDEAFLGPADPGAM